MAMYDLTVLLFLSEIKTHYFVDIKDLSLYYQSNGHGVV
jgi:hypothetical protein